MRDYIERNRLKTVIEKNFGHGTINPILQLIDEQPTADVVENKVLRLLLDWAIECGFGYDSIPEEYEKYKDDIQDMSYADWLIYIAMKEVEE